MAYQRRSSFAKSRGKSAPSVDWVPKVDKNPYYRTMDIFNGVFKKKVKLVAGKYNSTDLKTITVNFGETVPQKIVGIYSEGSDDEHTVYDLSCGHTWEGKRGHATDSTKYGMCWVCGSAQSYLGFEHEIQHILFKSDLVARAIFSKEYAKQLLITAPHVHDEELESFISILINAFDDIRCNSLWERIYPGSATAIWERWKRLTVQRGDAVNTDFMSFVFAVALDVPTEPAGEFESMRPIVEWATKKVRYRGFGNMLLDVRVLLDRCMGELLKKTQPQPPQQPQQSQQDNDDDDVSESDDDDGDAEGDDASESDGADGDKGGEGDPSSPLSAPSGSQSDASEEDKSDALSKLISGAAALDDSEEHPEPEPADVTAGQKSQSSIAMIAKALSADITDLDQIDALLGDDDEPDVDMAKAIQQVQDAIAPDKSVDSLLTSGAKANLLIIDVTPDNLSQQVDPIVLTDNERFAVGRMRAAFIRTMGRQRAKRAAEGNIVDVPALVQYLSDRQDPDVFESESVRQGFGYSVLCDMSGSMADTYPAICHAMEMLKKSLHFPFVEGHFWGFRGGDTSSNGKGGYQSGEVWMYRYHPNCKSYEGNAAIKDWRGYPTTVPVRCGGLTPLNSALNVAVTHLWKNLPNGMAKRMFLLTDGSPVHTKTTGGMIPAAASRRYVAQEIQTAKQHGIQVYTLIIGSQSIPDSDCKEMFGHPKFWKKTERDGPNAVDKVMTNLVLDNFTKYIKTR